MSVIFPLIYIVLRCIDFYKIPIFVFSRKIRTIIYIYIYVCICL